MTRAEIGQFNFLIVKKALNVAQSFREKGECWLSVEGVDKAVHLKTGGSLSKNKISVFCESAMAIQTLDVAHLTVHQFLDRLDLWFLLLQALVPQLK